MNYEESLIAPGTTGILFDETPKLTTASVRPFVWAILLYRGAVHSWEVVNAISAVCNQEDLKVANFDEADEGEEHSWVEVCVNTVLAEMLVEGLLRYNERDDLWVLRVGENRKNVPTVIAAVSTLNAEMPKHFLLDMSVENNGEIQQGNRRVQT